MHMHVEQCTAHSWCHTPLHSSNIVLYVCLPLRLLWEYLCASRTSLGIAVLAVMWFWIRGIFPPCAPTADHLIYCSLLCVDRMRMIHVLLRNMRYNTRCSDPNILSFHVVTFQFHARITSCKLNEFIHRAICINHLYDRASTVSLLSGTWV